MEISFLLHPLHKTEMMKKAYIFLVFMLTLGAGGIAQQKIISGIVRDIDSHKELSGVDVVAVGTHGRSSTGNNGAYQICAQIGDTLVFSSPGYDTLKRIVKDGRLDVSLRAEVVSQELVVLAKDNPRRVLRQANAHVNVGFMPSPYPRTSETYGQIIENRFMLPSQEPLSTFAVDVDAASYSNVRRMINAGELPPQDAVRIEEMVNYFQYELPGPIQDDPVGILTELSQAPWNAKHRLLRIGLRAKDIPKANLPAANLVFLIDVSGSMSGHNRLPLVKSSLKLLVDQLRDDDRVAIVTYAGSAKIKLPSTSGNEKMRIKQAIDELEARGATAGGAGIKLAFNTAETHLIKGGNNRVIMASDGDFNVGDSSDGDMEDLIEQKRKSGVHLTVLGFGMGNLKDSKMEILANKGHGNYAYIDNLSEARKAVVTEFGGTLFTVAKDVKIQVEFNPAYVKAYRLIGYENRLLEAEEFNDDTRLGGDMGVGHTVTALYEVVPVGVSSTMIGDVDALKYQPKNKTTEGLENNELATVKFRYKDPEENTSRLQEVVVKNEGVKLEMTSDDFRFASAVAEFGMLLRKSDFKQQSSFKSLIARAQDAKGTDVEGYRAEFIRMAENSRLLM